MRLNLGCGVLQFPARFGDKRLYHLKDWLPDSVYHATDWVNVDRIANDGVDQVVDVMLYPWPWPDNSADEIWASHLVEHIPHRAELSPSASDDPGLLQMAALDGWYAWFYEAWRVLKPGGVAHIVCPYAFSTAGVSDPTHHRLITPASFSYFGTPGENDPFDYQLAMRFEATAEAMMSLRGEERTQRLYAEQPELHEILTFFGKDIVDGMYVPMKAVKDAD